jgi:hypothetical protein
METQKLTPIDFIDSGNKRRVQGLVGSRLIRHGRWQLDGVMGKALCLIEISIPSLSLKLNFIPSEEFQDELLTSWLDAERENDNFTFAKPVLGNKRPSQLKKKLEHLENVLGDYLKAYCI